MSLEELGLNAKLLIAGFSGGVVHAFFFGERNIWSISGTIVGGLLTANYLGDFVAYYTKLPEGVAGFSVGLTAMIVCQGIIGMIKNWRPSTKRD